MRAPLFFIFIVAVISGHAQEVIQMQKTFMGTKFVSGGRVLKPKDVLELMRSNEEAYPIFKKAKSNYDAAGVLGFIGGFMVGWPVGTAIGGGDPQWGLAAGGAAIILCSIPLSVSFKKHAERAVSIYNGNPVAYKPVFYLSPYGTGAKINMKF